MTAVGVAALASAQLRLAAPALLLLAAYGACGLDGLVHYTLALCSEHTLAANVTIWGEALTGLALLSSSIVVLTRRQPRTRRGG